MIYDNEMRDSISRCLNESAEDKKGGRIIFDYTVSRHDDARVRCEENEFLAKTLMWKENGLHDEAEFDVSQNEVIEALKKIGFDEEDFYISDKPVVLNRVVFDYLVSKGGKARAKCEVNEFLAKTLMWKDNGKDDEAEFNASIAEVEKALKEIGFTEDDFFIRKGMNESAEDEAKESFIRCVGRTFDNKDNGYHFAIPIGKNFITGEVEGESNGDDYIVVYLVDKVDSLGYPNGEVIKDAYISLNEEKPSDEELVEIFGYLISEDEDDKIDESVDAYELESLINKIGEENGLHNIARVVKLDRNAFLDKKTHEGAYLLKYNNYDTEAFSKEEEKTFETNVAEQVTGWCDQNGYTCKWPIAGTLVVILEPKKIDESKKSFSRNDYWHNHIDRADVSIDGLTFEILFLAKTADEANEFIEKCEEKCGVLTETENGIIVVAAYK